MSDEKWEPFNKDDMQMLRDFFENKLADKCEGADARIAELQQERDGLEKERDELKTQVANLTADLGMTTVKPTGCVLDWGWLKLFEGSKGQVVSWQTAISGGEWYVRHINGRFRYLSTEAAAVAHARELAGLEPEHIPDAAKMVEEQPAEPIGCVFDRPALKVFEGPKGLVGCWQNIRIPTIWTVRSVDHEESNYSEVKAIAKARELAGLEPEPDEPPEAFVTTCREMWSTMCDEDIVAEWETASGKIWRAAKQEGGET